MVDVNELIQAFLISVERIIKTEWNPKNVNIEKSPREYEELIYNITIFTIKHFKANELELELLNIESNMDGVIQNKERCEFIAKKLKKELDSNIAKLYNKGRSERREKMNMALKELTVPFLRKRGFKGTFPNFTLVIKNEKITLKFQFSQFNSQYVVELHSSTFGKKSLRLGSIKNQRDYWYDFEVTKENIDIYKLRAEEVIKNWDEAETWLASSR